MRIKTLANSHYLLYAQCLEYTAQLLVNEIHAAEKVPKLIRFGCLNRRFRLQSPLKIVEHTQKFAGNISNYSVVNVASFAIDPLAIVFEVSLTSSQAIFEFRSFL